MYPSSCRGRRLIAIGTIRRGEEIAFDYNTTEFDMACPFPCTCGSAACLGIIRGYRHLTGPQRARIEGSVATHLRALAEAQRY